MMNCANSADEHLRFYTFCMCKFTFFGMDASQGIT